MNPVNYLTLTILGSCLSFSAIGAENSDYLDLKNSSVKASRMDSKTTLDIELKTAGKIPMDGKAGAFGYAFLTDGGNNVLVAVTHLPIDDSSYEHVPSGFHIHVLDLKAPAAECEKANFEVDLENSGKNQAFDANYDWSIKKNKLKIKNVDVSDLGDSGVEGIASFSLKPVFNDQKTLAHLCVYVVSQQ